MSPNASETAIISGTSPLSRVWFAVDLRPRRITSASHNPELWGEKFQMSSLSPFALPITMNCISEAMNSIGGKISRLNHFRLLRNYGLKDELLRFFGLTGFEEW